MYNYWVIGISEVLSVRNMCDADGKGDELDVFAAWPSFAVPAGSVSGSTSRSRRWQEQVGWQYSSRKVKEVQQICIIAVLAVASVFFVV